MKTIIMAGGRGTRIASVNSEVPKPLIEINHKPVLQYEIESLAAQGLNDMILTVSYKAEMIQDYFGDGSKFGCRIQYYVEDTPLGNAGAIVDMYEAGKLDGDFLLLNADSMFDIDFGRFFAFHKRHHALASLFTHPNSHPYDSGLVIADGGHRVLSWLSKEDARPEWYKNRVNAGLHILNSDILLLAIEHGIYPRTARVSRKIDLDRDILKPAVATHRIYAYDSPEYVKDMGTPDRFRDVCRDVECGMVQAKNLSRLQKAVFLDRDGTVNKYVGFLGDVSQFELISGVAEAIKRLNRAGYLVIVITNQPVIARGEATVQQLDNIHNKMDTLLGEEGAFLDAVYYCPHHPDKGFAGEVKSLKIDCGCRKPKPGLILRAQEDFHIDLEQSWMVGDSWRDVAAGKNAGTKTALLVGAGLPLQQPEIKPDLMAGNLLNFTEKILSQRTDQ